MTIPLSKLNQLTGASNPVECVRNLRRIVQDPFPDVDRVSVVRDGSFDPRESRDLPVTELLRPFAPKRSERVERESDSPPESDEPAWTEFLASLATASDQALQSYDLQLCRPCLLGQQCIGWLLFWRRVGASPISNRTRERIDERMPFASYLMMDLVKTVTPRREHAEILGAAVERMVSDGGLGKKETSAVLHLMRGCSYSEIGEQMHISVNTVGKHVRSAYRKLEVHSALEIVDKYLIEPWMRELDGVTGLRRYIILYP
jgi:DNA-binding CsgD family transcriptional regulator